MEHMMRYFILLVVKLKAPHKQVKKMNTRINEVRCAIQNELYNCVLTLVLTLPDICAKVEYGDSIADKGKKYQQWFNAFAITKFTAKTTKLPSNEQIP